MAYPDEFPESFEAGLVLPIRSLDHLHGFEEELAYVIDPDYDEATWAGRMALREYVYIPNFHGPLRDVTLTFIDEPLKALGKAQNKAKGKNPIVAFNDGTGKKVNSRRDFVADVDPELDYKVVGAKLEAHAISGRRHLGTISLDVWWGPLPPKNRRRDEVMGEALMRAVTMPRYDEELFKGRHEASKRRGYSTSQGTSSRSGRAGTRIDPPH